MVAREWGQGNGESAFNRNRVSVSQSEKVLEMDGSEGCSKMQMRLMPLNCARRNG